VKAVHGIIQHAFALQLTEPRRPFYGRTNLERISERFGLPGGRDASYVVEPVCGPQPSTQADAQTHHSPIAESGLTTVGSLRLNYLSSAGAPPLPDALAWAEGGGTTCRGYDEPRLIFADRYDDERWQTKSDFLVSDAQSHEDGVAVSRALLEVLAHKRSRLFGFALANRFVNVMLPHAVARPACVAGEANAWLLLPFASFIRGGQDRTRLRKTYSLSFFFIPVESSGDRFDRRRMSLDEIKWMVAAGWGYAAAPPRWKLPQFSFSGPLISYLSQLASFDLRGMRRSRAQPAGGRAEARHEIPGLTIRQAVERITFGVGLSLAQGKAGVSDSRALRHLGNEVVMALGSARVSSVVVADPELEARKVTAPGDKRRPFPGKLLPLMEELAKSTRISRPGDPVGLKNRLDQPFIDNDLYVSGVLPSKRCLIVVSRGDAQCGIRESALMQAGSVAYLTLGAATAIGTMCSIDRRVEAMEEADPTSIARIDREIATDLNEIYDLDITRESYREFYRRFRKRLGITRDYKTLQDEMETLYRATSTFHARRSERLLALLTAAIVVLSVFILVGTIVLIAKPGG